MSKKIFADAVIKYFRSKTKAFKIIVDIQIKDKKNWSNVCLDNFKNNYCFF